MPRRVIKKTVFLSGMKLRRFLVVAALIVVAQARAQVISDFATNADGWTAPNALAGAITYSATGGNPNGYVFGQTPLSINTGSGTIWVPFYFESPAKFEGNKSTYYNGTLRFDASQTTTGAPPTLLFATLIITDVTGVAYYYFPSTPFQPPSFGTWATFSVSLSAAGGNWKTANDIASTTVTAAQLQSVMSNIDKIEVLGLYRNANVGTRVDNITMYPPINITVNPSNATVCDGVTATFAAAANNNPSITYQWQMLNPFSGYFDLTNGGGYSNVTTQTLSVNTTGNFGAGTYRCRISGTGANDVFTTGATLTINALPTAPGGAGASSCGPANLTLTASGGTTGQYRWYTVATGGTAIPGQTAATYSTGVISTTTNYYVAINNGTCESTRTTVVATINTIPSAPGAAGASGCIPSAVTLTASGGSAGEYRWYTVSTGGTAIAGQTNSTYTTPTLSATTNYWVALNNGSCEGARTMVTATMNTPPTAPTGTGASGCIPGSVTISASGGTAGQYRWYTVPTGGTAIVGETNSTYTTPTLSATTNYYVAINNGTCESSRVNVVATMNTPPTAPTTTGAARCGTGTVTLTAAGGSAGQYRWYTVPTGGTAIAGQTNATYTTPSLTITTNYYASIDNGTCESSRTLVVATINTIPTAPTTTGAARCGTGTVTLTAAGGSAGQYRWYTVPTGGTAIAGQTNATYTTPSLTITTNYYASIDNGTCESSRTLVVATINTIPTAPTTTGASRCGTGTVTLTAAGGSAGQYRWYTVSTGGTPIAGQTNSTYTTPSLTTTTNYYVSIDNGTCESTRTLVVATINTIPGAPTTTGNSACGTASLTLTAAGGSAGQYRWYTVPTGGIAIGGQTNATYTTPALTTTTTYYVSIDNGTCASSRTSVVATINTIPSAPGAVGAAGCIPSSVTLAASGASAGQYRWYTVPTGGIAISGETNSSYTTPVISSTTTYYVSINDGTCEGSRTSVDATLNNPPVPPSTTPVEACAPGTATLVASGGAAGEYRWYTDESGGTAISGETNDTYVTPILSGNTTYYVAVNNGCESGRTSLDVTMTQTPSAPTVAGEDMSCIPKSFTLTASGGAAGQYRWYTAASGGTPDPDQSATFDTPDLSTTTTYYVAITNGACESARVPATLTIGGVECAANAAPSIEPSVSSTTIGGTVTVDLAGIISDPDNNLVLSTLTIVSQPTSGATATIDENANLVVDYSGISFTGEDHITIRVCDSFSACTEQTLTIDVSGNIEVYNGVSPNKDGKNDTFIISDIDKLEDTKKNHVMIFNRWGDLVWEAHDYNNTSVVFSGLSKNNVELPSGTYYYKIEFSGGKKTETGFLSLKR